MSTRAWWGVVGAGFAIAVVVAVVLTTGGGDRAPTTWVLKPGEDLTLSADEVQADDRYRCAGKGGVNGTPEPGHGVGSGGELDVVTDLEGTVHVTCAPGPPGNV